MHLDTRSGFGTSWRGTEGTVTDGLRLPPTGPRSAVTQGAACEEHEALILDRGETVALPDEARPTEALGWIDKSTLLVSAGGCGETIDLFAVDARVKRIASLALEVEIAAPRTQVIDRRRKCRPPIRRWSRRPTASADSAVVATGRSPRWEVQPSGVQLEDLLRVLARPRRRLRIAQEAAELLGLGPGEADRHRASTCQIEMRA